MMAGAESMGNSGRERESVAARAQRATADSVAVGTGAERWVAAGQRVWEQGQERGSGGGGRNGAEERVGADGSSRQRARGQRGQGQAGRGSAGC